MYVEGMKILSLLLLSQLSFSFVYPSLNYAINKAFDDDKKVVISIGFKNCPPCMNYKNNFISGMNSSYEIKKNFLFVNIDRDHLKNNGFDLETPAKDCRLKRTILENELINQYTLYQCFYNSGELEIEGFPYIFVYDPRDQSIFRLNSTTESLVNPYKKLTTTYAFETYSTEIAKKLNEKLEAISKKRLTHKLSLEKLTEHYLSTF